MRPPTKRSAMNNAVCGMCTVAAAAAVVQQVIFRLRWAQSTMGVRVMRWGQNDIPLQGKKEKNKIINITGISVYSVGLSKDVCTRWPIDLSETRGPCKTRYDKGGREGRGCGGRRIFRGKEERKKNTKNTIKPPSHRAHPSVLLSLVLAPIRFFQDLFERWVHRHIGSSTGFLQYKTMIMYI